jgi:hypothetical protein
MSLTQLKRVVLPQSTNVQGTETQLLQMGDAGRPTLERLDFEEEKRLVVVEVQGKGVTFIPLERVSCMDPMNPGEEKDYQVTSAERRQQLAVEEAQQQAQMKKKAEEDKAEAARQRSMNLVNPNHKDALKEAERIREEYRKSQPPPETTPFPAGKTPPQYTEPTEYEKHESEMFEHATKMPEMESKPPRKKRKYTKRKKKEITTS